MLRKTNLYNVTLKNGTNEQSMKKETIITDDQYVKQCILGLTLIIYIQIVLVS